MNYAKALGKFDKKMVTFRGVAAVDRLSKGWTYVRVSDRKKGREGVTFRWLVSRPLASAFCDSVQE